MSGKTTTKAKNLARDQNLITGFQKRWPNAQVLVDGVMYTETSAVAFIQNRVTVATTVVTTRAEYQAAVKAADAEEAATAGTVSGFVEAIYVAYGDNPAALADFGLPIRKKGVMTPAERIEASEKGKATRAARHTMGPKQKAKITGETVAAAASTPPVVTPTSPVVTPTTTGTAAK